MSEGGEVGEHVLKMIPMIERLEALDFSMDLNLQIDLILQSLPDSFSQFIINFNINEIECTLAGLRNKLVSTQSQMKTKGKDVVALTIYTSRPSKPKKKKVWLLWFIRVRAPSKRATISIVMRPVIGSGIVHNSEQMAL
ncbi:uncharacterized protein LOC120265086 [Dioscorea cayenensis subsp. rotundata]|uniref:Uncharacterized protein LOC120265086 n=1 Tax=Dioscorea cayennensis subsp. rotundata TaxID=55577 RepID=A0AB40BNH3_DIOCR|nr:uncharacterized protein LOC120265086 [Dioscorea cayenensis subsp. rotundata]